MKSALATSCRLALCAAVLIAAAGCRGGGGDTPPAPEVGAVRVRVNASFLAAVNIATITISVATDASSGPPMFPAFESALTATDPSHQVWTGLVEGIAAGANRLLTLQAFDTSGQELASGSARTDVIAGADSNVYIELQGPDDGSFANALPRLGALSASASNVAIGDPPSPPVALSFIATGATPGDALTYTWISNCAGSSFDVPSGAVDPAGTTVHWNEPPAVPVPAVCTLTLKVADQKQGTVTAFFSIQVRDGPAVVTGIADNWPVITSIVANEVFTKNASGQLIAVDYDLIASATDADGDDLEYTWSVVGTACTAPGSGFTATTPLQLTLVPTLSDGPGQLASSTVHFHTTDLVDGCVLRVDVTDYWPNGIVPPGVGGGPARGGETVGIINGSAPIEFAVAPQITHVFAPGPPQAPQDASSATYQLSPGQTLQLGVDTFDPTPSWQLPGTPFTYAWSQSGGAFVAGSLTQTTSSPGSTFYQWQVAPTFQPGTFVSVTVTSVEGLTASYTWKFTPANNCDGTDASVGTPCATGLGLCAPHGQCTAAGTCADPAAVVCAASTGCQAAGVCQPATGVCSFATLAAGSSCNADSNGCTVNDTCDASARCVAGPAAICSTPADLQCQSAAGTCVSTGPNGFTCSYSDVSDGTSCNADSNGCTPGDSCRSGTCTAGAPLVCPNSTNGCEGSSGTCVSTGVDTHSCNYVTLPDGTSCGEQSACFSGQTCLAGVCSGGTSACPADQACVTGPPLVCRPTAIAPQVSEDLQLAGPIGLAIDTAGISYLAATIYSLVPISFSGHPVASSGDSDIFLAAYDANGVAHWALSHGDGAAANAQVATGAAVSADGTLAVIGNFSGSVAIGSSTIGSTAQIDFLAGFRSGDGAGVFAEQFNDGLGGALKAIAANPNDSSAHGNRVAVCGLASTSAPADFVGSAARAPAGNDLIIGVFTTSGQRLWAVQLTSPGSFDEECDAIALDDNGDVYAAGSTSGASLDFGGATTALVGPGTAGQKYTWVAKLGGASGAAIYSAVFGGSAGQATPSSLTVDSSGDAIVGGGFTSNLSVGAATLTSAGMFDAWVAKLDPSLAPVWAIRLGGVGDDRANGVGVDSFGDVVAIGTFDDATSGAAMLDPASSATDAFVLKLSGASGSTDSAADYGDVVAQTGEAIAVNRYSTSPNQIAFAGTRDVPNGPPLRTLGEPRTGDFVAASVESTGQAPINIWPRLRSLAASATSARAGEAIVIEAEAFDANADLLSWQWSASCDGEFDPATSPRTRFLPGPEAGGDCLLEVRVSDGRGGADVRSLAVEVSPTYRARAR